MQEKIIIKEEIISLQNEIKYIINIKEIDFKYENIISHEFEYLYNKQKMIKYNLISLKIKKQRIILQIKI